MKRFHECASVRRGNTKVGFLIADCTPDCVFNSNWSYIDRDRFIELVKSNQVQYLTCNGDNIICKYSQEEHDYLRNRLNMSEHAIISSEKNYFSLDNQFRMKHIDMAMKVPVVAASLCDINSIMGMKLFSMIFIGQNSTLNILYNELLSVYPSLVNQIRFCSGSNVMTLSLSKQIIEQFFFGVSSVGLMVSSASYRNKIDLNNKLFKKSNERVKDDIRNYFDNLNNITLSRFNFK